MVPPQPSSPRLLDRLSVLALSSRFDGRGVNNALIRLSFPFSTRSVESF